MQPINESSLAFARVEINALNMFKLFLLLSLCAAFAYAAPSLSSLSGLSHGHAILSSHSSYHGWPHAPAVHVVRPVWTPHTTTTIVRPIIHHDNLGLNGYGYGHGHGHGHGWL